MVLVLVSMVGRLSCQPGSPTPSRSSLCFDAKHHELHGHCCALRTDLTMDSFLTDQRAYGRRGERCQESRLGRETKRDYPNRLQGHFRVYEGKVFKYFLKKTATVCHLKIVNYVEIYSPLIRGERFKQSQRLR